MNSINRLSNQHKKGSKDLYHISFDKEDNILSNRDAFDV